MFLLCTGLKYKGLRSSAICRSGGNMYVSIIAKPMRLTRQLVLFFVSLGRPITEDLVHCAGDTPLFAVVKTDECSTVRKPGEVL